MTTALTDRPEAPAGPPKLSPAQLRAAQAQTLDPPRRRYGILARALFKSTDLVYGPEPGIVKFAMLEFIARVPYQAWERIGYLALARLLLLPPVLAAAADRAESSYRLNADFEDHAEYEYMSYVAAHPELDTEPDPGAYTVEYGRYGSLADLFRQIGHDERFHKLDSVASMSAPRFGPAGAER